MINDRVCLYGERLVLVPYLSPHVRRYHAWMSDPELLASTESEALALDEEYENQVSWLHAVDKLTFILLAPNVTPTISHTVSEERGGAHTSHSSTACVSSPTSRAEAPCRSDCGGHVPHDQRDVADFGALICPSEDTVEIDETAAPVTCHEFHQLSGHASGALPRRYVPSTCRDMFTGLPAPTSPTSSSSSCGRSYRMIGDCNLFLLSRDADSDTDACAGRSFEIEVMVAEKSHRRRGLAEEAVRLLMQYAIQVLGATQFVAKILESNLGSLALFQCKLHFTELTRVAVFHEIHLARSFVHSRDREAWQRECLSSRGSRYLCGPYDPQDQGQLIIVNL